MMRKESDLEYLNYENKMKKKVLIYLNYICGIVGIFEFIGSCQVITV